MKVLLINGSPNARGCTYTALSEVAASLQKEGVETEILHVGHRDLRGCIGCRKCKQTGSACLTTSSTRLPQSSRPQTAL